MHGYEIVQERRTMTITADSVWIGKDNLIVFERGEEIIAIVNGKDTKCIMRIK